MCKLGNQKVHCKTDDIYTSNLDQQTFPPFPSTSFFLKKLAFIASMKRLRISAASSFISSLPVDWLALVVMTTDGCFWVAWAKNTGGQTWLVGGRATHVWNICIYFRGHYPSLKMEHKICFTRPSWLILLFISPFHADLNPFLWTNHFKVDFPSA